MRQRCLSSPLVLPAVNQQLDNIPADCQSVQVQLSQSSTHSLVLSLSLSQLQQECIQCVISRVSVLGVWFSLHHICAPPPTEAWKLEQATPYFILHCLSPLLYFFLQKWRVYRTDGEEKLKEMCILPDLNHQRTLDDTLGHTFAEPHRVFVIDCCIVTE